MTVGDITSAVSTDPATQAIVEVGDEASKNSGFFGTIAGVFEMVLKASDSAIHPFGIFVLSTMFILLVSLSWNHHHAFDLSTT